MSYTTELIHRSNQKYSSQYGGTLANHLPMALVALEQMGAKPEHLDRFYARYCKKLSPIESSLGLVFDENSWHKYLGQDKYHIEYLDYFSKAIATDGVKLVMNKHLPILFRGVGGGAFHGLIRLAYAFDSSNEEEIIAALSYWAVSYLDLQADQYRGEKPTKSLGQMIDIL